MSANTSCWSAREQIEGHFSQHHFCSDMINPIGRCKHGKEKWNKKFKQRRDTAGCFCLQRASTSSIFMCCRWFEPLGSADKLPTPGIILAKSRTSISSLSYFLHRLCPMFSFLAFLYLWCILSRMPSYLFQNTYVLLEIDVLIFLILHQIHSAKLSTRLNKNA